MAPLYSVHIVGGSPPRVIDKGTFMTDFASVQKHLTAITSAQTDFAKSSFEANKAYFDKLADAKSPDKFLELTTEYARSAQKTFVTEATKIGELYVDLAKEAYKPFEGAFAKMK